MKEDIMKRSIGLIIAGLFLVTLFSAGHVSAEETPQIIIDLAETKIIAYGTDPVIVEAVKAQNAKGMFLDDIKVKDQQWKDTAGIVDYMTELMENDCAIRLKEIAEEDQYYAEIFVMDNLGANVAMTEKTSDYWQGDEAKFQKAYNSGAGEIFIDDVEFDASTESYLVQISVPVRDGDTVIGAITFGVDVDMIE
jgi:hypothetical protein